MLLVAIAIVPPGGRGQAPQKVPVELIVVDSLEEAQSLLGRLNNGEAFAALAHERSTDPTSSDGGFLGNVDPDSLRLELRDALQGVQPGPGSRGRRQRGQRDGRLHADGDDRR